jgi:hypothetical protein
MILAVALSSRLSALRSKLWCGGGDPIHKKAERDMRKRKKDVAGKLFERHGRENRGGWRKRKGEVAESGFLAKAVSLGFGVAKPWGDSERYDFIVDAGGRLWRVQVKSGYRGCKDGGYTVHGYGNAHRRAYTPEEVDVIVGYIVPLEVWYVIPIEAFAGIKSIKVFPASRRRRSKHEKYREAWGWMTGKPVVSGS